MCQMSIASPHQQQSVCQMSNRFSAPATRRVMTEVLHARVVVLCNSLEMFYDFDSTCHASRSHQREEYRRREFALTEGVREAKEHADNSLYSMVPPSVGRRLKQEVGSMILMLRDFCASLVLFCSVFSAFVTSRSISLKVHVVNVVIIAKGAGTCHILCQRFHEHSGLVKLLS